MKGGRNYKYIEKDLLLGFIILLTVMCLLIAFLFSTGTTMVGMAAGDLHTAWREFDNPVNPGQEFVVSISMEPGDSQYYALEETVPEGFEITEFENEPGGPYQASYDSDTRTLRGVYLNMENPGTIPTEYRTRTYTIIASSTPLSYPYEFYGVIQFEGQSDSTGIENYEIMVVEGCEDECTQGEVQCSDNTHYQECQLQGDCWIWSEVMSCGTGTCSADSCEQPAYQDYPVLNSPDQQECENQCTGQGVCGDCTATNCEVQTETCDESKECQDSAYACGGQTLKCIYEAEWTWGTAPTQEENCQNSRDDDCDGECDYDSTTCAHGDQECPVEVTGISVSDENPVEYTLITITCTANAEVNSILAKVDDHTCAGQQTWDGNQMSVQCNVGEYSAEGKTISCSVDEDKSYMSGSIQEMQVTMQESLCPQYDEQTCGTEESCEWCPECSDTKSNELGQDMCVPTGECEYGCSSGSCGAECDGQNTCSEEECEDTCYDEYTLLLIPDLDTTCNDECGCELAIPGEECSTEGVEQPCGSNICEDWKPDWHITGSCQKPCQGSECGDCELSYPGVCECQAGWNDYDNEAENGCEESDDCVDECEQGDTRCNEDLIETCDYYGGQCLKWGGAEDCGTTECADDVCEAQQYQDYPLFSQSGYGACSNTCSEGTCQECDNTIGECAPMTETCSEGMECMDSIYACGGDTLQCYHDGESWLWGQPPSTEEDCEDGLDNNCDGECDYDSSTCAHGAEECPVEVTGISVSNENPEEYEQITIECTFSIPGINSALARIGEYYCDPDPVWAEDVATFNCNAGGGTGDKEAVCTINNDKSYQSGQDQISTLSVSQAESSQYTEQQECEDAGYHWCVGCQGKLSNMLGADACVPAPANCEYSCNAGQCEAECDAFSMCEEMLDCADQCTADPTKYLFIEDLPAQCSASCECEIPDIGECGDGVERPCELYTCEDEYPDMNLEGSCQMTCSEGECTPCDLEYPGECECAEGWQDLDEDPSNGCEYYECEEQWQCTQWSQGDCGTRTCTCSCPGGIGCSGGHSEYLECPSGGDGPGGGSTGGSSSGGYIPPPDPCDDGQDNEGEPPVQNGCIDDLDFACGGTEVQCWGDVDDDCDALVDCDDPDCEGSEYCEQAGGGEQGPLYTISDVMQVMFVEEPTSSEMAADELEEVARVEYFFGLVNWAVIALIIVLFIGLMFVQHIQPRLAPTTKLSSISAYIAKKKAEGTSYMQIRQNLHNAGWIDDVIDSEIRKHRTKYGPDLNKKNSA